MRATIEDTIVVDHDAYFDVLRLVEDTSALEPDTFIEVLTERYGLTHISYLDILPGTDTFRFRISHHNFPTGWVETYHREALYRHDIVLQEGMRSVAPLDWPTLRQRHPASEIVFSTGKDFGIPDTGMTFPQVSRGNSSAMFSFTADVPHREWPSYRRHYLRDIQSLATLFHAAFHAALQPIAERKTAPPGLTERESEVLKWSAAGKSYWEISMILGVSERTVRFFMTNARQKLNVVTNTQAVATAIWHGLIPPG